MEVSERKSSSLTPAKVQSRRRSRNRSGIRRADVVRYIELDSENCFYPPKLFHQFVREFDNAEEARLMTLKLGSEDPVTTSGSGILNAVYNNSPTNASNWAGYASVFDEFRVLGFQVAFRPLKGIGGTSSLFWAPITSVIDRSDATALTGYTLAARYQSRKEAPGMTSWTQTATMQSVEDGSFLPTNAPVANTWVKIYSSGNANSTTVGRIEVTYVVQFRGLGIN